MNKNQKIESFIKSNITVEGVYDIFIENGRFANNVTTSNDYCGLVIPLKGQALYELEGEPFNLLEGCILHAGTCMSMDKYVTSQKGWHFVLIHYNVIGSASAKNILENNNFKFIVEEYHYQAIKVITQDMLACYKESDTLSRYGLKVKLQELIYYMLQPKKKTLKETENERITFIKNYIECNIDKISGIEALADQVNMDVTRFTYLFNKMNNMSPKKYINMIRIKKAELLLINTNEALIEIAGKVGYEDQFYFSRFFKKHTGYAPSDFRKLLGKSPC